MCVQTELLLPPLPLQPVHVLMQLFARIFKQRVLQAVSLTLYPQSFFRTAEQKRAIEIVKDISPEPPPVTTITSSTSSGVKVIV